MNTCFWYFSGNIFNHLLILAKYASKFPILSGLKILSFKKLWWASDTSYKGKEFQEKTIWNPMLPSKRLCLSFAFAYTGSAGTHWGKSKGMLSLQYPNVQGEYLTAKSHDVDFFRVKWLTTSPCLLRGMGMHKRPVTSDGGTGCSPRQVMCQDPCWQPPAERRPLLCLTN